MIELSFSMEGSEVVHRRLDIVAKGVTNFAPAFNDIESSFMKTFDLNFARRGSVYGGWAPRKPRFRGGVRIDTWPLMEKTGKMRRGFESARTKSTISFYNTTSYFVYHQSKAVPRTRLPRRVMMSIRQQDAEMIVKAFQSYLISLLRLEGKR